MNEIIAVNIRSWQNLMMKKGYSQTYLKTLNNQLSAIFNHAVRLYGLKYNPCRKAGSMSKSKAEEMSFWTKEEFKRFIDAIMDKQVSYMSFMLLYWTGIRLGELLALTAGDIDFEKKTISINKSYQRIDKEDVITSPKTPKSKRLICIPDFLMIDLKDYVCSVYGSENSDCRLFYITKSYLEHEIARGVKKSGVKKIRIHDLRHPYIKHTTKNIILKSRKPKLPIILIVWVSCFLHDGRPKRFKVNAALARQHSRPCRNSLKQNVPGCKASDILF